MADVCLVIGTSHSPYLYTSPEEWEAARAARADSGALRADVPVDSAEENRAKSERCMASFMTLRDKLAEARPDVLLIFGDDQGEQFGFSNFPALGLFVGPEFEGYKVSARIGLPVGGKPRPQRPRSAETWTAVQGHPALARHLMEGLVERRFDLAFSMEMPDPDEGMGHAFMRPLFYVRPEYDIPTVPFFINCYYPPQPTGARCYDLGRSVRALIDAWDADLRVAVIGSGGLWHTPGAPQAFLNDAFDQAVIEAVRTGDAQAMGAAFDAASNGVASGGRASSKATGMRGGLGSGSGEVRNWIAAAAVADGSPGTLVDYVPVYASPCGMAFAYWDRP